MPWKHVRAIMCFTFGGTWAGPFRFGSNPQKYTLFPQCICFNTQSACFTNRVLLTTTKTMITVMRCIYCTVNLWLTQRSNSLVACPSQDNVEEPAPLFIILKVYTVPTVHSMYAFNKSCIFYTRVRRFLFFKRRRRTKAHNMVKKWIGRHIVNDAFRL